MEPRRRCCARGIDEVGQIFQAAFRDSVFSSVRWYGRWNSAQRATAHERDGSCLRDEVSFWAQSRASMRCSARGNLLRRASLARWPAADAFALAVYDAVWITASLSRDRGPRSDQALKAALVTAPTLFTEQVGTTLNAAGIESMEDFDSFHSRRTGSPSTGS